MEGENIGEKEEQKESRRKKWKMEKQQEGRKTGRQKEIDGNERRMKEMEGVCR